MNAMVPGQASAAHPDGFGDTATCKHCRKPIARCASLSGHAGCRSGYGWIHSDPDQWGHTCEPRSAAPYALPEPAGGTQVNDTEPEHGADVTREPEIPVYLVQLWLCDPCLDGEGEQCHTPGCSLWIHDAPKPGLRGSQGVTILGPALEPFMTRAERQAQSATGQDAAQAGLLPQLRTVLLDLHTDAAEARIQALHLLDAAGVPPAPDAATPGQAAYEERVRWDYGDNPDCLTWDELGDEGRAAWEATANAAVRATPLYAEFARQFARAHPSVRPTDGTEAQAALAAPPIAVAAREPDETAALRAQIAAVRAIAEREAGKQRQFASGAMTAAAILAALGAQQPQPAPGTEAAR